MNVPTVHNTLKALNLRLIVSSTKTKCCACPCCFIEIELCDVDADIILIGALSCALGSLVTSQESQSKKMIGSRQSESWKYLGACYLKFKFCIV